MKKRYKKFGTMLLAAAAFLLSGCIDEADLTSAVSSEQLSGNASSTEALLWGMSASLSMSDVLGDDRSDDYGIGSIMHILDIMGEEYVIEPHFYDWYDKWSMNEGVGANSSGVELVWVTLYRTCMTANALLGNINPQTANDTRKQYLAAGHAFRAAIYLDAARMYEFLPNDGKSQINKDGKDVFGLTVPFVFETTSEKDVRNNPRVFHTDAFNYIKEDLEKALSFIEEVGCVEDKTFPGYYAVCGLLARAYMWHGSFLKEFGAHYDESLAANDCFAAAARYAKAAQEGGDPLTKAQWTDVSTGFNTFNNAWLWGYSFSKEGTAVQSIINNWTSWASNEVSYGYAAVGPFVKVDARFYNRIPDTDFRKLSWKAPQGHALYDLVGYCDKGMFDAMPDYASVKIRPGEGEPHDYNVASAVSVPLMRVEEMIFIEMEALAQMGREDEAETLLTAFMRNHRNPDYQYSGGNLIDEIFFQKRVELWGEGRNYFDYKRLNKGVTRRYEGSTFGGDAQMNTATRPAWMNLVLPDGEIDNNEAVRSYNNPDPSGCYVEDGAN